MIEYCPACTSARSATLVEWPAVPTNSAVFFETAKAALDAPKGPLRLVRCLACGLIYNADFDAGLPDYSHYVETQSTSPHHLEFQHSLADDWLRRHDLRGETVVEVGCGAGAPFLYLICDASGGRGIGIDPAVTAGDDGRVRLIQDVLGEAHVDLPGSALICRHTLEHIADVRSFLEHVREWSARHGGAVVLFEVPESERILREGAFWDVYYEHVGYYTAETLASTFALCGFAVERVETVFHDQYLVLEGRPSTSPPSTPRLGSTADAIGELATSFVRSVDEAVAAFSRSMKALASDGPVVVWQASSKAVGLLTVTGAGAHVTAVTDANEVKYGLHLAGTGHRIVPPSELARIRPAHVVVMNEVYVPEIADALRRIGVETTLHSARSLLESANSGVARPPDAGEIRPCGGRL